MDVRWRALAVLTIARIAMGIQFQSLPSVSAGMMQDIALSYADVGFLVGLYFLPGVVVSIPAGMAGPRYGDKRIVLAGLALMFCGGVLTAAASSATMLAAARALSGVGAVLLNVLMSKMITDWFAGRELPLAMSIFVNSFPVGIGLALMAFGSMASTFSWRLSLAASALVPAAAFLLVASAYQPHANERATGALRGRAFALPVQQLVLVCLAGAMWGSLNGAFAIMTAFSPAHLVRASGLDAATAAAVVGASTWAVVVSVQVGGLLTQRWKRRGTLLAVGCIGWAFCAISAVVFPYTSAAALVLAGLLLGLPIGLILSLPGQALAPEQRGMGMGVFYLWLYIGHGLMPPVAGWAQDRLGSTSASLLLVGGLALVILGLYGLFALLFHAQPATAVARMKSS